MHGFQICLLHLIEDAGDMWLQLLDAPTDAIGWTGGVLSVREGEVQEVDESILQSDGRKVREIIHLTEISNDFSKSFDFLSLSAIKYHLRSRVS